MSGSMQDDSAINGKGYLMAKTWINSLILPGPKGQINITESLLHMIFDLILNIMRNLLLTPRTRTRRFLGAI